MSKLETFIQNEGLTFPGKTYVEELLKPVFNDQRDYLFDVMFEIHRAHVIMLAEQSIISKEEANIMLNGINKVGSIDWKTLDYLPKYEDLFFMMEAKIGEVIGDDLAGKIHIGRSRNDMGIAMYRLVLRKHLLTLIGNMHRLSEALLEQAKDNKDTYITGYTHTQPAQPTTFGHYLLAIYDVIQRDIERMTSAYKTVNKSALGAAALTTTGFPINRERVCELLGFDEIIENSYDAIGGADYLLETGNALMTCMVNTGRWIQDFLLHVTREYGTIYVADPYVQCSSIMPQKRNPVSIEHSRSIASSAFGDAMAAVMMIHNTPFGDIVDTEDDLQPHLYRSFNNANRVMKLMYAVIATMKVDKAHALKMAQKSSITITELADTLSRDYGLSFRKAHSIASHISIETTKLGKELYEWNVADVNQFIRKEVAITLNDEEWQKIISPEYFVGIRNIPGGPSPTEVTRMIDQREKELIGQVGSHQELVDKLETKRKQLIKYQI